MIHSADRGEVAYRSQEATNDENRLELMGSNFGDEAGFVNSVVDHCTLLLTYATYGLIC